MTLERVAKYSGLCPLCVGVIRGGRSTVVSLPDALVPLDGIYWCADRRRYRCSTWAGADELRDLVKPRQWAHAGCAARLAATGPDWEHLAADRRAELRERRRHAERDHRRGCRGRR